MSRLTRKFGDKVILPIIPMEINSKEDYEKYHGIRREYENMAIKLAEYEDREEINDCLYCCGYVDNRESLLIDDFNDGIYISGNNTLVGTDDLELNEIKINYCPMCGRKL